MPSFLSLPGRSVLLAALASLLYSAGALAAETLTLNSELRINVPDGRLVFLEVRLGPGEVPEVAVRRVAKPGTATPLVRETGDGFVAVPLEVLSDDLRSLVLRHLFPSDRSEDGAWIHVARSGPLAIPDEGLWQVAAWFCGNGALFEDLRAANGSISPELAVGQRIRIPEAILHPAFRARPTSDDGALFYDRDAEGEFAGYRLAAGEALWSAVVLRFTDATAQEDVEAVARSLARRSGIRDLTDIPVGWVVKIPFDVLQLEHLPPSDPRRVRREASREEAKAELPKRSAAEKRPLDGVVVILDPGHGGQDLGTINNGVWEHDYVYDVVCRLDRRLKAETGAKVYLTVIDSETGTRPVDRSKLAANRQGTLQTTPPFLATENGDTAVGVYLRWYLANSIYRRVTSQGTASNRVVFLSVHADSRHPSLRGAMVYVPGADYRGGTYGSTSSRYLRFREVRERPTLAFSSKERARSEAVSRAFADRIVRALRDDSLPVQAFRPVRERVIRGGADWLPAVLRGNAVPTKVLVEILNLANADDAGMLADPAVRERLARALLASLISHFGGGRAASANGDPRAPSRP